MREMEKLLKNIQKGNSEDAIKESGNPSLNINSLGKKGMGALHLAVQLGDPEVVEALLERRDVDVNIRDAAAKWTPLMYLANGAGTGDEVLRKLLSRRDCDINCTDSHGMTALHHACKLGRVAFAESLLSRGADVNRRNGKTETPLHVAILEGHEDMAFCLLARNADVNTKDSDGMSPLHLAVQSKMANVCKAIVDSGKLQVDACFNFEGDTPLHLAASLGLHNVMELLQKAGFSPSSPNNSGHTALDFQRIRDEEQEKEHELRHQAKREKETRRRQHCADDSAGTEVTRFCVTYGLSENTIQQLYHRRFRMLEDAMAVLDDKTLRRFGLSQEERKQFFAAKELKAKKEEEERSRQLEESRKAKERKSRDGAITAFISLGIFFAILYAMFELYMRLR